MRDHVTFLLNGRVETVRDIAPTTMLLDWLRRSRRLTGSKEGCGEGDCGACTIVVGRLEGETVGYRAANACIQLLPMLEGASVLTVEAVAGPGGSLHPVQQALVESHGSQCGFCTPGFVMSLYAAYLTEPAPSRQRVDDLLAGNLCRCTGYRPIVDAALAMHALPRPAWDIERRAKDREALLALRHEDTVRIAHGGQVLVQPASLPALMDALAADPQAVIVAGGTDVGLWVTKQHRRLASIVDIGRVSELQKIEVQAVSLRIAAGVTYARAQSALARHFPDLAELMRRIGAVQVRNVGTIGGNIANGSPIGDMAPALIALEATLVLRRGAAQRRIALEEFFVAYGRQDRRPAEIVEAVEVPLPAEKSALRCYKVSKRFDQDISTVCGCFDIRVEQGVLIAARIAFGGMAATPKRARNVEAALMGQRWQTETVAAAQTAFDADFQPISDLRGSAAYRRIVARNMLERYFHETATGAATRLAGAVASVS